MSEEPVKEEEKTPELPEGLEATDDVQPAPPSMAIPEPLAEQPPQVAPANALNAILANPQLVAGIVQGIVQGMMQPQPSAEEMAAAQMRYVANTMAMVSQIVNGVNRIQRGEIYTPPVVNPNVNTDNQSD